MEFRFVASGARWESIVGYSRALRAGPHIYVTGTAPVDDEGAVFAPGDAYRQARRCFEIITRALAQLGAEPRHVVRTRLFVTDIRRWEEFGRAHREFVGEHRPCTTMVEVRALIDPLMLVEVEVDAVSEEQ
jgi:enamine deaminase RidA (YjgF/YER057c/UK114 family)